MSGVSIEKLESETIRVLKSGIVEIIKSQGATDFVDSVTNAIGKYGTNIDTFKKRGFVKPYAMFNGELINPRVWTGKLGLRSRSDFFNNLEIQENICTVELRDLYEEITLNGAIQPDDSQSDIAGMLMVAKAAGSAAALAFREGREISPRPMLGVYQIDNQSSITSQVLPWFNKGYYAPTQAGSINQFGKSPNWFSNYISNKQQSEFNNTSFKSKQYKVDMSLPAVQRVEQARAFLDQERTNRAKAIKKFKATTDLIGSDMVQEFYKQVISGSIKY